MGNRNNKRKRKSELCRDLSIYQIEILSSAFDRELYAYVI